jgi:hypothetical protein
MMPNPLVDAAFRQTADGRVRIDLSTYVAGRGFTELRLTEGESLGFDIVRRFLTTADAAFVAGLSQGDAQLLRLLGLLLAPGEQPLAFVVPDAVPTDDSYARDGVAVLPRLVPPAVRQALIDYYRKGVAVGAFVRGDKQIDRYYIHNDPAARVAQRALQATVEQVVGVPLKGSYTYASLYCGSADLPPHKDRLPCRYTLSLQIDHQPLPADGRSPWPIHIHLKRGMPSTEYFQTIGGGILFRGHDLAHYRPALPPDQTSWTMLLHYIEIDFDGPLD